MTTRVFTPTSSFGQIYFIICRMIAQSVLFRSWVNCAVVDCVLGLFNVDLSPGLAFSEVKPRLPAGQTVRDWAVVLLLNGRQGNRVNEGPGAAALHVVVDKGLLAIRNDDGVRKEEVDALAHDVVSRGIMSVS